MAATSSFSLARRLRAGETVFVGWCGMATPIAAETIIREGFPAAVLDQQHGLYDMATTAAGIMAVHHAGGAPIVRMPVGDFAVASRALDLGAEGIVAPMINSTADAKALVAATKFPPLGERSWGPVRALTFGGFSDAKIYLREANDLTVTFAMIETRMALANLDAIAGTPGIDGLFLGPSDLSIALSNGAVLDPHSAEVDQGFDRIVAAADKAGKIAGAFCLTAERALALAKRGARFLSVGSDTMFLRAGTAAALAVLKGS